MPDLITQNYLTTNLADYNLTANQTAQLPGLTASASRAIRKWCHRYFNRRSSIDELYTVEPRASLILFEHPVNAVARLCTNPTPVIGITNTDTATNQRATAALATTGSVDAGLTVTGLTITRVASGVTSAQTLLFATYVTITALAAAVNAAGGGWKATVYDGYGPWATADLRAVQGVLPAIGASADFVIHVSDVPFSLEETTGIVNLVNPSSDPFTSLRFGPYLSTDWVDQQLSGAVNGVRCVYDAGYDTVPEDVQLACVETVKAQLERFQVNANLASETAGVGSYTVRDVIDALPSAVRLALAPWRNHRA
jgi:hypothetical protein